MIFTSVLPVPCFKTQGRVDVVNVPSAALPHSRGCEADLGFASPRVILTKSFPFYFIMPIPIASPIYMMPMSTIASISYTR
jgi:hypothetical protein